MLRRQKQELVRPPLRAPYCGFGTEKHPCLFIGFPHCLPKNKGWKPSEISSCKIEASYMKPYPKDPAILKTLRDSELLRRSVFIAPPQIYYAADPSLRGRMSAIPRKMVSTQRVQR